MTGPAFGPGPYDNPAARDFLDEVQTDSFTTAEAKLMLTVDAFNDLELAQEQYALAALIADSRTRGGTTAAGKLTDPELPAAARDSMNRLIANPYATIWQGHADGGITIRRKARAVRARLHRAAEREPS